MNKHAVLHRLQQRIDYIYSQVKKNERPLGYLQHKADILDHLEQAVMRIHSGEYGSCKDCERFIGIKRLKVVPGAIRCVECQTLHEKKARRK